MTKVENIFEEYFELEIKDYVKESLSKHEYPRIIEFVDDFPKTPKGNIKKQELIERSIQAQKNNGKEGPK